MTEDEYVIVEEHIMAGIKALSELDAYLVSEYLISVNHGPWRPRTNRLWRDHKLVLRAKRKLVDALWEAT